MKKTIRCCDVCEEEATLPVVSFSFTISAMYGEVDEVLKTGKFPFPFPYLTRYHPSGRVIFFHDGLDFCSVACMVDYMDRMMCFVKEIEDAINTNPRTGDTVEGNPLPPPPPLPPTKHVDNTAKRVGDGNCGDPKCPLCSSEADDE